MWSKEAEDQLRRSILRTPMTGQRMPNVEMPNVDMMAGQQSGTSGPYMTPEQLAAATKSTSGQELGLKNQLAQANALRGAEAAKGKTVGPYDLYMGPNWGDMAASLGKQLTGGYMAGKANEGLEGLDEKQSAVALEKAINEQKRQQFEDSLAASAVDYEKSRDEEADRDDERDAELRLKDYQSSAASRIASADQARANSGIPMIQLDEEGTPMQNSVRFATKRPDGMYFGDEKVDESTWQPWDNPNLNAAKLDDTRSSTQSDKKADFLAGTFSDALLEMDDLLDTQGYDPTSLAAYKDKVTNKYDPVRFLASAEGQQYQSTASTLKEAALRTATGAAAKDTEDAEYISTLIPSVFDKDETVAFKRRKLRAYKKRLDELGTKNPDATPDELVAQAVAETKKDAEKPDKDGWVTKPNGVRVRKKGS